MQSNRAETSIGDDEGGGGDGGADNVNGAKARPTSSENYKSRARAEREAEGGEVAGKEMY